MTSPNFFIVGAAKAGTTSLYRYLRQHPQIYLSRVKEPGYYWQEAAKGDHRPIKDLASYRQQFAGVQHELAIGEATPRYLTSPTAAARIAADHPQARIIVSLRHPVDRAYSSYLGRLKGARERASVDEAMRPGSYYFRTSHYATNLARYFQHFPREQIRVLVFEEWVRDPRPMVIDLFRFLGVDPDVPFDASVRHNPAGIPRFAWLNALLLRTAAVARPWLPALTDRGLFENLQQRVLLRKPDPMPKAARKAMLDHFRDDIRATEALIGRDLPLWLR